jgi:hypothetical protein
METYTTFDSNVQCEEDSAVSEAEYNEVMQMMAEESAAFEGVGEWSEEVEQKDWLGNYSNRQDGPTHEGWMI